MTEFMTSSQLELSRCVAELSCLNEEVASHIQVMRDYPAAARTFMQQSKLVQGVRIVFICLGGCSAKPDYGFTRVSRMTQERAKQDHAQLVHRCRVAERCGFAVKQDGSVGVLFRSGSDLVADCRPVRGRRMIQLGGHQIKIIRLFVVDLQAELTGAVQIGEEKLSIRVGVFGFREFFYVP